jgi:hypothetical protein
MQAFSEYGSSVTEKGSGQLQDFGNGLTDTFQRQPFALGAIGAMLGAAVAASLPLTEMEATRLGRAGKAVKERAGRAMDAAADEARKQGLTTEGIKSAADETTTKLGRVVDAANQGIAEQANTGQAKAGQARTGQDRAGQDKANQARSQQDR